MTFELIADCCSNEIGSVRVEPFLDHEVDVPKVDKTQIDRDFLGIRRFWSEFSHIVRHGLPSTNHPSRWYMDVSGRPSRRLFKKRSRLGGRSAQAPRSRTRSAMGHSRRFW